MKPFFAFLKKEGLEQLRTGRLLVLLILFTLFGIMNPAIAKLTPWLMQTLSSSLAEAGMTVSTVTVDALTSWTQFYKNIPMAFLVLVLMMSSAFTAEYQKGTLIPVLTKGLGRTQVLLSKALMMALLWAAGLALCYGVTYGYTAYYWDNGILRHLAFAAFAYGLFGVWVLTALVLFSALLSTGTGVLLGTGAAVLTAYLLGFVPGLKAYLPLYLTQSLPLLTGALPAGRLLWACGITVALCALQLAAAAAAFRKRSI